MFELTSKFKPTGDQPMAIKELVSNLNSGIKDQVLLGVTGSGKSVAAKTQIFIKNDRIITREYIGNYIDNLFNSFKNKIKIINDSEIISTNDLSGMPYIKTYSFNPYTKKSSWKPITYFIRHRSPKYLYKITTTCGREIITTGDHNFFALHNEKLDLFKTTELQKNHYLPLPTVIEEPLNPISFINLSHYFDKNKTYVSILKPKIIIPFKKAISKILIPAKISNIAYHQERISFKIYQSIISTIPEIRNSEIAVGSIKKNYQFPLIQKIDDTFIRLLGYYIAEGHCSNRKYFTISSGDEEIISDFTKTLESLNLKWKKRLLRKYDYQISSSFWSEIISQLCGDNSKNKHFPHFWPQLSNTQLSNLLRAYFSADGGVESGVISCTTASKELASDIMYALLRFGIIARLRNRRIKIPGKNVWGKYWTVSISGKKFIEIFQEKISFSLNRKNASLGKIIKNTYNTNVDIVPVNGWFKEIREKLNLFQIEVAASCGINRSYISMIENNERMPSKNVYKKIINFLKKNAKKNKNTELLNSIKDKENLLNLYWTPIKSIEKIRGEKYVYDLSVKDNETFLAGFGGIFAHNTFTMASVIEKIQKPVLVISPNKTLAAQLYQEFKEFFPNNGVHYFVSYYDYYQPEAYIPQTDTYIEKDAKINEEIDRLRHSAVQDVISRKDVIVVASVSCIYNIGSPENYQNVSLDIKQGQKMTRKDFISHLISMQYKRNDIDQKPCTFRVRGDVIEVYLVTGEKILRVEFAKDKILKISISKPGPSIQYSEVTGSYKLFPGTFWVAPQNNLNIAIENIRLELQERLKILKKQNKLVQAQRLEQRTNYDLELLQETGFCHGIENYSRQLEFRKPGSAPFSLVDYFKHFNPNGFLLFIDESHIATPQIRAMSVQDRIRKETLIDFGFRLPSAVDNRPLTFKEFQERQPQTTYVSATPADYEKEKSGKNIVQQIIRPTGLLEPKIEIKKTEHQIEDLMQEIKKEVQKNQRVLVVTLTKRLAEEISDYLIERGFKTQYLHSEIKTMERPEILKNLREGKYDVLVGINLLREGLDLPEVALIAILDADKEGFLRNKTTLIQTMGRAARHKNGRVILYADKTTGSMQSAIDEINRRRKIQEAYNKKNNIKPTAIIKDIRDWGFSKKEDIDEEFYLIQDKKLLEKEMKTAAKNLDFERAAELRDLIDKLKNKKEQ